jgi:hypothetical protein
VASPSLDCRILAVVVAKLAFDSAEFEIALSFSLAVTCHAVVPLQSKRPFIHSLQPLAMPNVNAADIPIFPLFFQLKYPTNQAF